MLTLEEVGEVPPWPGMRNCCMLEKMPRESVEPLGFVAWDVMLSQGVAQETSGWISDDLGGRVIFHALPDQVFQGPNVIQPVRTIPLLMWLTHRALRVLYQCTPGEAEALADRLLELGPDAVGSEQIEECSPAALIDVLWRWIDEDPAIPTMPGLGLDGKFPESKVLQWRPVLKGEHISRISIQHPLPIGVRLLSPPKTGDEEGPTFMTYDDDTTVLVPMRLLYEDPRLTPQEVVDVLDADQEICGPLIIGGHEALLCQVSYRAMTLLAPVQAPTWRERVTLFRDRLAAALSCEVACSLVDRSALVDLCISMRGQLRDIKGAEEVYYPPFPGARTGPPERLKARELRCRLMNAVGLPLGEAALAQLQVGEIYH